ncbi:glycosyltransferase family 39 protein [Nannocystis bainbridge]|uniref:Glycosyltransferase family 39 protein n=1 Tax=Nannocystis bainbridge TaxID=2995303 RepID=A0ABT5DUH6_9BACT|nr:glycosyltransferase family 39 protein [Nannocystis bainbridge]MDC0717259.1 glycosyltransferase family 39 protein [Nannocystis bainbridge]
MFARREIGTALALAGIAGLSCLVRLPGFREGGFASHDVGGILYEAMLLRAGGLPYVDAIELKAPGTFYLATVLAGPDGRDIAAFQIAANLVALASLLVLAVLAWRLWGARAAVVAAALYALHDAHLDSMDANYVTWAQLPAIAAGLCAARAAAWREEPVSSRRSFGTWLLGGVMCGLAALCKQPSGVVLLPVLFWAVCPPGRRDLRAGLAVLAGFLLAHLPVGLHYLARGHLGALLGGYVWNPWGFEYIARNTAATAPARAAWELLAAAVHFLALPLALALLALTARPRGHAAKDMSQGTPSHVSKDSREVPGATRFLLAWTAAAVAAAATGLRFYKGYWLGVLPPLCLLAAAPWGVCAAAPWRRGWPRLVLAPLILALTVRAAWAVRLTRDDRARPHDEGARAIGRWLGDRTGPDDTIWVWGWHLWGVHAYSGRLSASRVYKTLGLLTTTPDDTWRTPAGPPQMLADGPWAQQLLRDLAAAPPAFVAIGGTAPKHEFPALRRFLAAHYVRDYGLRFGKVEIWRRADR